jgi:guanosine-3',5'-bis(diphosphate) 3'-pyrophosphohydrolase
VGSVFAENKTNITAVKTQSHRDKTATLELAIEVRNTEHLAAIMQKVRSLGDILAIHRATGAREEARLK